MRLLYYPLDRVATDVLVVNSNSFRRRAGLVRVELDTEKEQKE